MKIMRQPVICPRGFGSSTCLALEKVAFKWGEMVDEEDTI